MAVRAATRLDSPLRAYRQGSYTAWDPHPGSPPFFLSGFLRKTCGDYNTRGDGDLVDTLAGSLGVL